MGIRERKERERERRKQQITVAAKRIFLERGFDKATMEDIAKEAELSAGTLYLYFKNKHELYASITLKVLQFLNMRLAHIKAEKFDISPKEKLDVLKDILLDAYDFDSMALINLFHLQSRELLKKLSPEFIKQIKKITKQITDEIADIFEEGIEKGVFIKRHPAAFAQIIISAFSGIVLWEEGKKSGGDKKDYVKPTIELVFEILTKGMLKERNT
ncbi:MAG: TetR/AcrR family transcriptional regulator [Deltaproteobacteria bacterium]|nr:TetR/AcrR family transcriptional regulator [Deltaproteobacteria bacterium]